MDPELKRQVAAFEAARVLDPVELEPRPPRGVLAVHDGTDQDARVDALAAAVSELTGAEVETMPAAGEPEPLTAILERGRHADLLIVPCPFRRDYSAERAESLSTIVDLLLSRCPVPVLLARGPVADARTCLNRPLVVLTIDRHRKVDATARALAFARDGGSIALLSVVDPHQAVHEEELLGRYLEPGDLSLEVLEGLASARAAALTAALQKGATTWNVEPRIQLTVGDPVETALEANADRCGLLVAGLDRTPTSEAAQRARRLVLGSSHPVLLV